MGAGAARPVWPQAAAGHEGDNRAARLAARQLLGEGRDRFSPVRRSSFYTWLAEGGAAVPELPSWMIDYYKRTKIYPIMHLIVIRKDVYERHPCRAQLYKAFSLRNHAMQALTHAERRGPSFAWPHSLIEEEQSIIGGDWFLTAWKTRRRSPRCCNIWSGAGPDPAQTTIEELSKPSTLRPVPWTRVICRPDTAPR